MVLRSGQSFETKNYAVMGQTLWNFSRQPVQKVPLSEINIPASEKANAQRGIEFAVTPGPAN